MSGSASSIINMYIWCYLATELCIVDTYTIIKK